MTRILMKAVPLALLVLCGLPALVYGDC